MIFWRFRLRKLPTKLNLFKIILIDKITINYSLSLTDPVEYSIFYNIIIRQETFFFLLIVCEVYVVPRLKVF